MLRGFGATAFVRRAALGCAVVSLAACAKPRPAAPVAKPPPSVHEAPHHAEPVVTILEGEVEQAHPRRRALGLSRPHVTAYPIVRSQLPAFVMPPVDSTDPPSSITNRPIAWDSFVAADESRGIDGWAFPVLRTTRYEWGTISVGARSANVDARDGTDVGGVDIRYLTRITSVRWEGLRARPGPLKDPVYEWEVARGWYDPDQSVASVETRTVAAVTTIVPERLFAFRECDDKECKEPKIALVAPHVRRMVRITNRRSVVENPPSRIVLETKMGVSETIVLERKDDEDPISIEVQQGTADREPIVTAFRDTH